MCEKKNKAVCESVIAQHCSVLTVLDSEDQNGFEYSDIIAARKVCPAMSSSQKSSQKEVTTTHYFFK
jgi:hypothetical protein